jgi:hypothetical protein
VPEVSPALTEALQALYAVEPDAFMAARRERVAAARAGGDRDSATEIGRLRKPTVAAWSMNLLARQAPEVVDDLVALGARMRTAQARLDAATLTALRPERDEAVRRFVGAATDLARGSGRTLAPAALEDIRATAVAALADEGASTAVSSGQLTRALSYSGFGEVDLSEAVARTASGAILTVVSGTGGSRAGDGAGTGEENGEPGIQPASAEARGEELEAALEAAQRHLEQAETAVVEAREHADDTRQRLAVVERQLAKAREADERALEAVTDAVRARKQATAARDAARQALAATESGAEEPT